MTSWYVVRTKPQSEFIANRRIREQGFETFLPLYRVPPRERTQNRSATAETLRSLKTQTLSTSAQIQLNLYLPLFPRYLFVQFDSAEPGWVSINSTRGVSAILMYGSPPKPSAVPQADIQDLLDRSDFAGALPIHGEPVGPRIYEPAIGETVSISSDPRGALVVSYLGPHSNPTLARVRLDLFGGIETTVPTTALRPLE